MQQTETALAEHGEMEKERTEQKHSTALVHIYTTECLLVSIRACVLHAGPKGFACT